MKLKKKDLNELGDQLANSANAVKQAAEDIDKGLPEDIDTGEEKYRKQLLTLRNSFQSLQTAFTGFLQSVGEPTGEGKSGTPQAGGSSASAVSADAYRPKFEQFLAEVGDAVLSAQRNLDLASQHYLEETQPQKHVLPSVFRVPKLSANMKFALEKSETKGVNLVFFSKGSEAKELHQQAIEFEIVSIPAPLEALRKLSAPRLEVVLDPQERSEVLDAAQATADKRTRFPDGFEPLRVVVLRAPDQQYILLYADKAKETNVGLWVFTAGETPELKHVYRFQKKVDVSEQTLRDLVFALGERQKKFLAELS